MSISAKEFKDWANSITDDCDVAIDNGGLTVVVLKDGVETEAYFEIGGVPNVFANTTCEECGNLIPNDEQDEVNASHSESCSLHPTNVEEE